MRPSPGGRTTAVLLITLAAIGCRPAHADGFNDTVIDWQKDGADTIALTAKERASGIGAQNATRSSNPHPTPYQRMTAAFCRGTESPMRAVWISGACEHNQNAIRTVVCEPGQLRLDALWSSTWNEDQGLYGEWRQENIGACLTTQDLTQEARHAFELLTVPAPTASIQPATWSLVNLHSPAAANAAPLTFEVTLLDIPVVLEATPTTYSWDFGDGGAPLVTDDPGRTWQDGDPMPDDSWVGHTWTRRGTYTVTLTTTWAGRFSLAGTDAWQDIDVEVTTTSSAGVIEVAEARSQLVAGNLNG